MIRLVAFDLDGTLLGRDLVLSERVRTAVTAMQGRGIQGCIVTGRMFAATLPYVKELQFDAPVVCYQGAAIFDPHSGRRLFERSLAAPITSDLIAFAAQRNLHLQLYKDDRYFVLAENAASALYARLSGVAPIVVPSLSEAFTDHAATKAVIVAQPLQAARIADELRAQFGARAYVTRSYPEFVEILNPDVDKGSALAFVAEYLGVPVGETMAIGDSWNDRPLLQAAGFGVAMGDAPEELRAVAQAVVGTVANDGVAEALDRYAGIAVA